MSAFNRVIGQARAAVFESVCSDIRHRFHDQARPAVRVALGAYVEGDISWADLEGCLNTCAKKHDAPGNLSGLMGKLKEIPLNAPFCATRRPASGAPVLIREDNEIARQSWTVVLDAILAGLSAKGILHRRHHVLRDLTSGAAASTEFQVFGGQRPLRELSLLLLDYALEDDHLAAEDLKPVRDTSIALPIVLLTAWDEAAIARWCLQHGASDYFVKELSKQEDRESRKHYTVLRDSLVGALRLEHETATPTGRTSVRAIYEQYTASWAACAQAIDRQQQLDWGAIRSKNASSQRMKGASLPFPYESCDWDPVDWHLRQAFRYLLGEPFWCQDVLHAGTNSTSAYIHGYAAAEAAIDASRARAMVRDGAHLPWGPKLDLHSKMTHAFARWLPPLAVQVPHRAKHLVHECQPLRPATHEMAVQMLVSAARLIEHVSRHMLAPAISSPRLPVLPHPVPARPPAIHEESVKLAHATEAELGAVEFAAHAFESLTRARGNPVKPSYLDYEDAINALRFGFAAPPPQCTRSALFVDDSVDTPDDRWSEVLRLSLAWSGIAVDALHPRVLPEHELQTAATVRKYDLVLLDLQMPEELDGLKLLAQLKRAAPEVPVVIFTASAASLPVRRALASGANAYFLKRRGRPTPTLTRYDELVSIVTSLNTFQGTDGMLRKLYTATDALGARQRPTGAKWKEFVDKASYCFKGAWGYAWWAEAAADGENTRALLDKWLVGALGPYDGRRSEDGAKSWALIQCGKVLEEVGRMAGLITEPPQYTFVEVMKKLDTKRGVSNGICSAIWEARSKAVHGQGLMALSIADLVRHIQDTLEVVEWYVDTKVTSMSGSLSGQSKTSTGSAAKTNRVRARQKSAMELAFEEAERQHQSGDPGPDEH